MRICRMGLCDKKWPSLGFNENRLRDERLEQEAFEKNIRWNFYKPR